MRTDWSYSTLMTSSTPNFQIPSVISAFIVGRPFWDSIWQQPDVCIILHSLYDHIADQPHKGYYKLGGQIPRTDIADNSSHHLSKRSQADSDHRLEEPSHMKSDGVDAWLKHWLKLQKKNKRPLVLKRPSDEILDTSSTSASGLKSKGKKGKAWYVEPDDPANEEMDHPSDNSGVEGDESENSGRPSNTDKAMTTNVTEPLPTPYSASDNRRTRRQFLVLLSANNNYKQLMLLLHITKVGETYCWWQQLIGI